MSAFEIICVVFISLLFLTVFYSVIRWLAVFIADRQDTKRRKKYAIMCAVCILILILIAVCNTFRSLNRM